jgi:N6-adenosine-specific RNA methylase IME4
MKKYQIIYADPPWKYSFPGTRSEKKDDYATMRVEDIMSINVAKFADKDCALFVWGIWTGIEDCLRVIRAWGFDYKTVAFVWVKTKRNMDTAQAGFFPVESFEEFFGMGMWTRSNTEFCLIATKGKPSPSSHSVRQIIYSPLREHSCKPDETRKRIIELMGDLPRIELFAREKTDGWDVWGNEVESDIKLEAVDPLFTLGEQICRSHLKMARY